MRYFGGKSKTASQISMCIDIIRKPGQTYWEPFVGGGWVLSWVKDDPVFASDANEHLIEMWKAIQDGWIPPENVSEEEYTKAQNGEYPSYLIAFILFACSYGGKWGGGYARGEDRNWAKEGKESLLRKKARFSKNVHFFQADFLTCDPPSNNCLIYCDPPYENTTGYGATGKFDTVQFWNRVRNLENKGHTVLVSEYNAPDDFTCIQEMITKTDMNTKNGKDHRIEKLFRFGKHSKVKPTLFDLIG